MARTKKAGRRNGLLGAAASRQAVAEGLQKPRKTHYRARAHSNPLNDAFFEVPAHPDNFDWSTHYPAHLSSKEEQSAGTEGKCVQFVDVGCGFGGLLLGLSPLFPNTLMCGFEIREKVALFVQERIKAQRTDHPGTCENISCLRSNTQRYLKNFFRKGQLKKLFFLFPDPHFKVQNHRRRIISTALLAEYAYLLEPGGLLYTATDVKEVAEWMQSRLDAHPLFERLSEAEVAADVAASLLTSTTEEAKKVARAGGQTWKSVHRRRGPVASGAP